MKYLFFLLPVALYINPKQSYCQCPSNKAQLEITAGYGIVSGNQLTDQPRQKISTYTVPFANVRYFVFNRLAIGLYAGLASEQGNSYDYFAPQVQATYKKNYTTIAAELYYIYTFSKRLEIFTTAGIGSASVSEDYTTTTNGIITTRTRVYNKREAKIYYSPLGIRYGGRLGCFAALGLGYKGIISGGISYKFGPSCWWKQNEH